jgi:hypothetical protein
MDRIKGAPPRVGLALLFLCLALNFPGLAKAGEDLASFLPKSGEVKGWDLTDEIGQAKGEELFELINGGAEVYLRLGFVQALLATYGDGKDRAVNLELFQMKKQAAAKAVFEKKATGLSIKAPFGDRAAWGDYYLFIHKGVYQIALTASFQDRTTEPVLKNLAEALLKKLP